MGKANFTEDFKRDAVLQITERGYPVAEVSARLGINKHDATLLTFPPQPPEPANEDRTEANLPSPPASARRQAWKS